MYEGRHFRVLYILLDNERAIAPELAEGFGVSVRTIYRDIDTMSVAGIPVYMQGGHEGGIHLLEGCRSDKVTLSETEQAGIPLALQGLGAIQHPDIGPVFLKLDALFMSRDRGWIDVDLTRWGTAEVVHRDKELLSTPRKVTIGLRRIYFECYNAEGEMTVRIAEPTEFIYRCRV